MYTKINVPFISILIHSLVLIVQEPKLTSYHISFNINKRRLSVMHSYFMDLHQLWSLHTKNLRCFGIVTDFCILYLVIAAIRYHILLNSVNIIWTNNGIYYVGSSPRVLWNKYCASNNNYYALWTSLYIRG